MGTASVTALYRYPVKSLGGESLTSVEFLASGPQGDRNWAVMDLPSRSLRNAKRWPSLLLLAARYLEPPRPDAYDEAVSPIEIAAPDGETRRSDAPDIDQWLSAKLDRPAHLVRRRPASEREHYRLEKARTLDSIAQEIDLLPGETLPNFFDNMPDLIAQLAHFETPPGSYVDAYPIHLIGTRSLRRLHEQSGGLDTAPERFRPNLIVDGDGLPPESEWVGKRVAVGEAILSIPSPTSRCSMPGRAQPLKGVAAEPRMTRALVDHCGRFLGYNALVEQPGPVRVGDAVRFL